MARYPQALPQYRVHHLLRTAGVEAASPDSAGWPWRARPTAASASRPASPAAGPRRTRSCEPPCRAGDASRSPRSLAGVLLALSLPPWGWWPLGLVGAALLYWRLAGLRLRGRLWSGWLAGLGCYAIGLVWARAFNWYGALVLVAGRGALPRRGGGG